MAYRMSPVEWELLQRGIGTPQERKWYTCVYGGIRHFGSGCAENSWAKGTDKDLVRSGFEEASGLMSTLDQEFFVEPDKREKVVDDGLRVLSDVGIVSQRERGYVAREVREQSMLKRGLITALSIVRDYKK